MINDSSRVKLEKDALILVINGAFQPHGVALHNERGKRHEPPPPTGDTIKASHQKAGWSRGFDCMHLLASYFLCIIDLLATPCLLVTE